MGQVHNFLGLSVGIVLHDMKDDERRAAYASDITYVTNNELGFDYLRDNMAIYKEQLVLRDLHYCIIDEVDSVLIDEARTPLIISGQSGKSTKLYELCDVLARQLVKGTYHGERTKMQVMMQEEIEEDGDFIVNEKDKVVNLTEQGVHKVEQFFHIDNYADIENLEIQHNVTLALRAHYLMFRNKTYAAFRLESERFPGLTSKDGERCLQFAQLPDVERYSRMYYDLSINIEGIDAIHHLLKRMESMQQEIYSLHSRLRLFEDVSR